MTIMFHASMLITRGTNITDVDFATAVLEHWKVQMPAERSLFNCHQPPQRTTVALPYFWPAAPNVASLTEPLVTLGARVSSRNAPNIASYCT